jgi:hypothetical protein
MIGIIYILVNIKDNFSVGVPFNIDDEVKYIGSNQYFIFSNNGEPLYNAPPGLTMGEYITSETRGRVLGPSPVSFHGRTYVVRFYAAGTGADFTILEDELELYPNITPIPLPDICASRSQP